MQPQIPLTRDLVLIGGGHAHALVLRAWGMAPVPGVRVTLINPAPTAPYTGMLPGYVAGHYARADVEMDLIRLARFAGARLILGRAVAIDAKAQRIRVSGRGEIGYDVASLDVGITGALPDLAGFAEHGVAAKPMDDFTARWSRFLSDVDAGNVAPQVAVLGAGLAGVELALAMRHRLGSASDVSLIERATALAWPARRAEADLARKGVALRLGAEVCRVEADHLTLDGGGVVPAALTVATAGARAQDWLAASGLPVTPGGDVVVGPSLQVEGHLNLFAVGDCAHMAHAPRPKAGVYAVRAAPVLLQNLKAVLVGGQTAPFHPQREFLKLVSLGDKSAIGIRGKRSLSGAWVWPWKDRIDRRFMAKFHDLPQMDPEMPAGPVALGVAAALGPGGMLCAGCGAKVAPGVLAGGLSGLDRLGRADVLTGPGDDAAVLAMGDMRQVLTTDHLRAFTEDLGLFARIATLHALGDIWAMGAAPQAALVSITLPHQSDALQARAMDEVLTAISEVLSAEGAEIVGGHSSMGAELSLGLTLTGLLDQAPITMAGARPGDVLLLTRAIGSGTLLAGEMRGLARGRDVARALAVMATPQGAAARALGRAHAMTDVTGFGLAGHLMAMVEASGVGALLDLEAVPVYDGALELAAQGVRSTIHAANAAAAPVTGAGDGARYALLHDPQTAGGFLAALAPEEAKAAMAAIGSDAVIIGRIVDGAGVTLA